MLLKTGAVSIAAHAPTFMSASSGMMQIFFIRIHLWFKMYFHGK
jgi:hypothetical protein